MTTGSNERAEGRTNYLASVVAAARERDRDTDTSGRSIGLKVIFEGEKFHCDLNLWSESTFGELKGLIFQTIGREDESPLLYASYKDADGDTVNLSTETALRAMANSFLDASADSVTLHVEVVDSAIEAQARSALFLAEGSAQTVRARRRASNERGLEGSAFGGAANRLEHARRESMKKFDGLIKEKPFRKAFFEMMLQTAAGRSALSTCTAAAMQTHLKNRALLQKGIKKEVELANSLRRTLSTSHERIHKGRARMVGTFRTTAETANKALKRVSALQDTAALLIVECLTVVKGDPDYPSFLNLRARVIIAAIIKFYTDFSSIYGAKLLEAQAAMEVFNVANPEYDPQDDENGMYDDAVGEFTFDLPSAFVDIVDGDKKFPPVSTEEEE